MQKPNLKCPSFKRDIDLIHICFRKKWFWGLHWQCPYIFQVERRIFSWPWLLGGRSEVSDHWPIRIHSDDNQSITGLLQRMRTTKSNQSPPQSPAVHSGTPPVVKWGEFILQNLKNYPILQMKCYLPNWLLYHFQLTSTKLWKPLWPPPPYKVFFGLWREKK